MPADEGPSLSLAQTKKFQSKQDVISGFARFLRGRREAHAALLTRLRLLRRELQASAWLQHHEIIGSSLLFVYDTDFQPDVVLSNSLGVAGKDVLQHSPILFSCYPTIHGYKLALKPNHPHALFLNLHTHAHGHTRC